MLDFKEMRILDAAEALMTEARSIDEVTVRRIAERAGASHAAIAYHFGSRDRLFRAVMERTYKRFRAQRAYQLRCAIDEAAPGPPTREALIRALVEPSIRWSCDPRSPYAVFRHYAVVAETSADPEVRSVEKLESEQFEDFVAAFRRVAPRLSDGEIGWRLYAALAIRTAALHQPERGRRSVRGAFDLRDPDALLAQIVGVVAPMFD